MPRLTDARREARRADIVAAARRCFSRDGFHQTSMPSIAAEAGLSAGAPYRYFASKEDLIVEIAGQAFTTMFDPLEQLLDGDQAPTLADMVSTAVQAVNTDTTTDAAGRVVPVQEMLRCGVLAWSELLRDEQLRRRAAGGFDRVREHLTTALRRGQDAGVVAADLHPERASRVVMALLHGFMLQRTVFDLKDIDGFVDDVRTILIAPSRSSTHLASVDASMALSSRPTRKRQKPES